MSDFISIDDGLFPVLDGIQYEVIDGIDPTYDLRKLLSDSIRARPQWEDLAAASSRVLYDLFERYRQALGLARTPENISRVYKILALKMLGLDYKSASLQDIDYDRALNTISLYNQDKGPIDFIHWIGYVKGSKFDLATLWTQDYVDFQTGPGIGWSKVYDSPPGEWFPTTHVGLLYEEFLQQTDIDAADLTELFYKMAPINLVLDWIASQVTLSLGVLFLSTTWYETTEDTLISYPPGNYYPMVAGTRVAQFDLTLEKEIVTLGPFDWTPLQGLVGLRWDRFSSVDEIINYNQYGIAVGKQMPVLDFSDASGILIGALLLPRRTNYFQAARNIKHLSWLPSDVDLSPGEVYADGTLTTRVDVDLKGTLKSLGAPAGTHCITWEIKPISSPFVAIKRGSSILVINTATLDITVTGTVTRVFVREIANGYLSISGVFTGPTHDPDVTFYSAWGPTSAGSPTATGSIYWRAAQCENARFSSENILSLTAPVTRPSTFWTFDSCSQLDYISGYTLFGFLLFQPEWQVQEITFFHAVSAFGSIRVFADTTGALKCVIVADTTTYTWTAPTLSGNPNTEIRFGWRWDRINSVATFYANHWSQDKVIGNWPDTFTDGILAAKLGEEVLFESVLMRATISGYNDPTALPSVAALSFATAGSVEALLLETGYIFLAEDGSYIILE